MYENFLNPIGNIGETVLMFKTNICQGFLDGNYSHFALGKG